MATVREFMTTPLHTISHDQTLVDAARRMKENDIGTLAVEKDGETIGFTTDRDIVIRGLTQERDANNIRVRDVMTEGVQTVDRDASTQDAIEKMKSKQIRRLVVTDSEGKAVGLLSMGDVAQSDAEKDKKAEALETVTKGCC